MKLVASGNRIPKWDRPVLESLGGHTDYISVHYYASCDNLKDYYEILGSLAQMDSLSEVLPLPRRPWPPS